MPKKNFSLEDTSASENDDDLDDLGDETITAFGDTISDIDGATNTKDIKDHFYVPPRKDLNPYEEAIKKYVAEPEHSASDNNLSAIINAEQKVRPSGKTKQEYEEESRKLVGQSRAYSLALRLGEQLEDKRIKASKQPSPIAGKPDTRERADEIAQFLGMEKTQTSLLKTSPEVTIPNIKEGQLTPRYQPKGQASETIENTPNQQPSAQNTLSPIQKPPLPKIQAPDRIANILTQQSSTAQRLPPLSPSIIKQAKQIVVDNLSQLPSPTKKAPLAPIKQKSGPQGHSF